jgi:hypothetical protein
MGCQARSIYFLRANLEPTIKANRDIKPTKKKIKNSVPSELAINFWALFIKILNAISDVGSPVCGSSSTLGSNLRFMLTNATRKKDTKATGRIFL